MTLSHAESGSAQTPVFGKCSSSVARDGSLGTAEELGERPLALDQWQIAQLVAVLLDQIEGVQYHLAAPSFGPQRMEPPCSPQHPLVGSGLAPVNRC